MHLKTYQQNALDKLARWLEAVEQAQRQVEEIAKALREQNFQIPEGTENYPKTAWKTLGERGILPLTQDGNPADHVSRTAGSGDPIPHACMKVPTGGGKTLLGVAALEAMTGGAGFVLWIVPTRAIYEQTWIALRTREHPYRQRLERMSGGRVKLLQKSDRFTREQVESRLCIMLLMLPSANRQKNRDFLKIFRDSGGYASFFPREDDAAANKALLDQHRDLEESKGGHRVRHSLINVLKLLRPVVVLDEAHKAYGNDDDNNREFVRSVNRLNPRRVLELSATPKVGISNILVDISGAELHDEEMIKLPIEVHAFTNSDWRHTLAETQRKLKALSRAAKAPHEQGRYIRPIAVVRVQRTGKDQQNNDYLHAEKVRAHLMRNLSVPAAHIRVQSADLKELDGEDLLSEGSQVRWIITKDALKEGWDCAFAYLLALLDNTKASTAITQMVGRVMRQPGARRVEGAAALNRCYIYCHNPDVSKVVGWVKAGLEREGLTGLEHFVAAPGASAAAQPVEREIRRRRGYDKLKIFLPQVLHRAGRGWRPLDYERDILGAVDWGEMDGAAVSASAARAPREVRVNVGVRGEGKYEKIPAPGAATTPLALARRLADVVPNPWQAMRIAEGVSGRAAQSVDPSCVVHAVEGWLDERAEVVFRAKLGKNQIRFHLEADEQLNHLLENSFTVPVHRDQNQLTQYGNAVQRSLFEPVFESDFNPLEKDFALHLDNSQAIHWWHRIAARRGYSLQGWRRHRVYPDFVACREKDGKLLIMEIKGGQLSGNDDTNYKKKLLRTLEQAYPTARDYGKMNVSERPAVFRMLFADQWQAPLDTLVDE